MKLNYAIAIIGLTISLGFEASGRELYPNEQGLTHERPAPYLEATNEELERGIKAAEESSTRMLNRYNSEEGLKREEYSYLYSAHLKFKNQAEEFRKHLESRNEK